MRNGVRQAKTGSRAAVLTAAIDQVNKTRGVLIWMSDKLQFDEIGRYDDKLKFVGLSI